MSAQPEDAEFEILTVSVDLDSTRLIDTEVQRRRQRDGSSLWAVKRLSQVLTRDGEWEYEPIPSSRDEAFIARARFATMEDAIGAYLRRLAP